MSNETDSSPDGESRSGDGEPKLAIGDGLRQFDDKPDEEGAASTVAEVKHEESEAGNE